MKRILTFSLLAVLATVIFASCSKHDHWDDDDPGNEYAYVDGFYDGYPFCIVQYGIDNTYGIVESKYMEDPLADHDELYGNFSEDIGFHYIKNITQNFRTQMKVRENGIYNSVDANAALNDYCDEYDAAMGYSKKANRILIKNQKNIMRSANTTNTIK
ncbi:hypothetical protein A8C56_09825 [Niabella ginsenosidivorans]|uniref:Lipoprotein n=1 Tax=Niabella ginsenosidivorans TaxID=1176587 RepID=A0A1A9I3U4_9BACT|nr:hypothetical protein [Niabella ginsenosidivorans]ANH81244.1 hypothetical protein A8C56_09825 [Niabella ginsenosidivorans]